jgi:23S rRNA pseudouridine2605 synthase
MRLNKYIAQSSGLARRAADEAIVAGRVLVNDKKPQIGQDITEDDRVMLDGKRITPAVKTLTVMLHKPAGYVCSRDGQGSKTVYDLLPTEYRQLKPVGRLDKDSSGLLLLTNDGQLAYELTHPKFQKTKIYQVRLHKALEPLHHQMITDYGVELDDGLSKFQLAKIDDEGREWQVTMTEGRNRQIRRTFSALGYTVRKLHRIQFGMHVLGSLPQGMCLLIS